MAEPAPSEKPRTKWWRRLLLVIAVGPGAFAISDTLEHWIHGFSASERNIATTAAVGALWGLTAGILRGELAKIIIGVNFGAFSGGLYAYATDGIDSSRILLLAFSTWGCFLGAILNTRLTRPVQSTLLGASSGFASFAVIWLTQFLFIRLSVPPTIGLRQFTKDSLILTPGLYLFFWLIADVLPRREAAREKGSDA